MPAPPRAALFGDGEEGGRDGMDGVGDVYQLGATHVEGLAGSLLGTNDL